MKKLYIASVIIFMLPIVFFSLFSIFDSDRIFSDSENRELATCPDFTLESFTSGEFRSGFESYYNDQFPMREEFLGVAKTFMSGFYPTFFIKDEDATTVNGKLIYNGRVTEIYKISDDTTKRFAKVVNDLTALCGNPETFVLIPTPPYSLYAPEKEVRAENKFIHSLMLLKNELDSARLIDLTNAFADNKDEYLFFKTDHHWTARGAYLAARELVKADGGALPDLEEYKSGKREGFFGSLYKSIKDNPISSVLEKSADTVEYFFPKTKCELTVYSSLKAEGEKRELLYPDYDRNTNLYHIYMGGDIALGHIKTELKNGKSVMVVRDSYGHAFIPFLVDAYEDIYFVEPRYFDGGGNKFDLAAFFKEKEIDTLVFLSYPNMAIGSYWNTFSSYLEYMK